ncbi:monocyte chemotactic protein 1B-like [Mugil cephalus]|uniref:monocyte chemotactic protein 1B-like n=1 Tax=Mugil cephalus TaxID=48193 RepID=UPI001FB6AAEA|nr:monocyte chemotactic protein 1B-like [Mugil cephalus]
MASWCDVKLFLCILVVTCCCTETQAQMPSDCCLTVTNKTIAAQLIADYYHQPSGRGCSVEAIIFVTRRERKLCVQPQESWVEDVKVHVDKLRKFCKDYNYKPQRCNGVKPNSRRAN